MNIFNISIALLILLASIFYLLRKLKNVKELKGKIMDIGIIGIIIFTVGMIFHSFELAVAGSLIWTYGIVLFLIEEYRKGESDVKI